MNPKSILKIIPLSTPWPGIDPFLFCMHHDDAYPPGNEMMGPNASLAGRDIGQDFAAKDGWNMYHGDVVPGFPQHPHRGFETVTIVRKGLVDHSDSLGASARFGGGDTQWITAGRGIAHSEMMPLLNREAPNPLELFQIWVNLPKSNKLVDPHFSMLWADEIPKIQLKDEHSREIEITLVAGTFGDLRAPTPPPKSWASDPKSDFAIWNIKLSPQAKFTIPKALLGTNRTLYFYVGKAMTIDGKPVLNKNALQMNPELKMVTRLQSFSCCKQSRLTNRLLSTARL